MNCEIMPLISEEQIKSRIKELAQKIREDFGGQELVLIGLLKGSIMFLSDLSRELSDQDIKIDLMIVSSYGSGTISSRSVEIKKDIEMNISGKNVIVIEDIVDSGHTLSKIIEILKIKNPKVLKVCTMLSKMERREVSVKVDYIGFNIPDQFVVGFGLDFDQKYRNLPYIGVVKN